MLARLQSAIGRDDLIEQMVLLPEPKNSFLEQSAASNSVNLIVAYNGSPHSHTALDIAFWIAHQTRLATNTEVTVQAVYVLEDNQSNQYPNILNFPIPQPLLECELSEISKSATLVLTHPKFETPTTPLQEADRILWQARSLAEEWQGSFKSHLRFGSISTELRKVVELEAADILFVGCQSLNHPMIEALESDFPCAVLGIPSCIDE
ncbi:MAG: universal stress protein [Nostoc sp. ChiSLP02]|nr:universal stress protein [Nostoc sp. DedSLP05]MDZ8103401.1 universal stress protein [Nostoc sp. DedSLP01]MDZ8185620.1 universal stress protein [Nostoc sp. ChiSLP02]